MIVYIINAVFVLCIGYVIFERQKKPVLEKIYYIIVGIYWACLSGLRYEVGIDYQQYVRIFHSIGRQPWAEVLDRRQEVLFCLLNKIIYTVCPKTMGYLFIIAIISFGLILFFCIKYTKKPYIVLWFVLAFNFYAVSLCLMRQFLAISISVFALKAFQDKKYPSYALLLLIACGFHTSALILLLPAILSLIRWNRALRVLVAGVTGVVFLFSRQIFELITVGPLEKYHAYLSNRFMNPTPWVLAFYPLFIAGMILYLESVKKNGKKDFHKSVALLAGIFSMFSLKHYIMERVGFYFTFYCLIILVNDLCSLSDETEEEKITKKRMWALTIFVSLMAFAFNLLEDRCGILPYQMVYIG